MIFDLILVKY